MHRTQSDFDTLDTALSELHQAMSRWKLWEQITGDAKVPVDRGSAIILHLLNSEPARPCHPSELANYLGVEAPSVTRKIQQLEAAGLVARRQNDDDRRVATLSITPAGRLAIKRLHQAKRDYLSSLLNSWPAKDRRTLAKLLKRLSENIANQSYPSQPITKNNRRIR